MNKKEIKQYLMTKYKFNLDSYTLNELKTFINLEKYGYKIEQLTENNAAKLKDFNVIRFNYSFIAYKENNTNEK
jgi:hypothetical protein